MAKIRKPVLKLLERLYGFIGAQDGAPRDVELGLGITPVHDLSRMSEIGSAKIVRASAGYWLLSVLQAHTIVGSITTACDLVTPGAASEGYAFDEEEDWAWWIDDWLLSNDSTDFSIAVATIQNITNDFWVGPSYGTAVNPDSITRLMSRWTSQQGGALGGFGVRDGVTHAEKPALILSPQDGVSLRTTSDTGGTITYELNVLLWIGKRGTFPPGYA